MHRGLMLAVALTLLAGRAAAAGEPRLLLSWNAPYGSPRALENIAAACDSAGLDTLYLSFDPGRDSPTFLGMSGTLYFHAAGGDSLGSFWKIDDMNQPSSPLHVGFDSDSARAFQTPYETQGAGQGRYDYTIGSGRLRMIYAVPENGASPVKSGRVYGLARVTIRHPHSGAGGCAQPICVEWHDASLAFTTSGVVDANRGQRWVSLNSPNGKVCDSFRDTYAPKTWKPKSPKP